MWFGGTGLPTRVHWRVFVPAAHLAECTHETLHTAKERRRADEDHGHSCRLCEIKRFRGGERRVGAEGRPHPHPLSSSLLTRPRESSGLNGQSDSGEQEGLVV